MKVGFSFVLLAAITSTLFISCLKSDPNPNAGFEEQWKMDTTAIGSYLRSNNITTLTDASGVRFVIDSLAVGFPPRISSTVKFKYKGRLLSGTIFDDGTTNGLVRDFVTGFQVGLLLMTEGSKARIYIPSGLAYGSDGSGAIAPNTNIMFELQLTEVVKSETEKQRLATDTVAIDQYLSSNSINAVHDQSGVRYVVTQLGTGAKPTLYSKIKVKYSGRLISDGSEFFNGTEEPSSNFDSRVINYIFGLQPALTNLPVGSKATVYIPSGLGFGSQAITSGSASIPANSNLIYDVELLDIVN